MTSNLINGVSGLMLGAAVALASAQSVVAGGLERAAGISADKKSAKYYAAGKRNNRARLAEKPAASASGWYAGFQFNSTGFTAEDNNNTGKADNDYSGLVNTTLFVGRDFNLRSNFFAGAEVGVGLLDSSSSIGEDRLDTDPDTADVNYSDISRRISREISLRVRGGYDLSNLARRDNTLAYVAVGYAGLATSGAYSFGVGSADGRSAHPRTLDADAGDVTVSGLTQGVGVEIGLTDDLSGRLEYTIGAINRLSFGFAYLF